MKKNFKYKVMLLKSNGWKHITSVKYPYFGKNNASRCIEASIINIMTLEQIAKFLEVK